MAKNPTDFTNTTKNTTDFTQPSKNTTDLSATSKTPTNFALNATFENSNSLYDEDADYDSATDNYDGTGAGSSPLGSKNTVDFTQASKTPTDFSG